MTTIIGITHKDGVLMAADRAAFLGTQRETLTEPKIIRFNNVLIGVAGTLLVFQRVKANIINPPSYRGVNHVYKDIAEVSRNIATTMKTAPQHEQNAEFLVAIDGKLYTVLSDGTYLEAQRGYAAIGSGAAYALGALRVYGGDGDVKWSLTASQMRAEKALETASEFDMGTGAPFDFITLETESEATT